MPITNKIKVCAICGKSESTHWTYHWKSKHPNEQKTELHPGQTPSAPFIDDWINAIKCEKTRDIYLQATIELPPLINHIVNNEVNIDNILINIPTSDIIEPMPIEDRKAPCNTVSLEDMTTG